MASGLNSQFRSASLYVCRTTTCLCHIHSITIYLTLKCRRLMPYALNTGAIEVNNSDNYKLRHRRVLVVPVLSVDKLGGRR